MQSPSSTELLVNSILFFFPSFLFFAGRFTNAFCVLRKPQLDDYLMGLFFVSTWFSSIVYTTLLVLINVSARYATNLFPPEQLAAILADSKDVKNRITGSIVVIMLEQCMLLSTWGCKVCLLLFLYRMTDQMPRTRIALWAIAGYVGLSYALLQVLYFFVLCRPFEQYYALPVSNSQCATYSTYSKVQMPFNITSDVLIILLPTSVLWRSGLPLKRKLLLMILFSLGIFTIICAVLNKYYNFANPQTTVYQLWYIREASVAMWIGNLVCCWQLAQLMFHLRSFDDKHSGLRYQMREHNPLKTGMEKSIGGHNKITAWYDAVLQTVRSTAQNSEVVKDYHYEAGDNHTTIFSLFREEDCADAKPAINFRNANNID